MWRPFLTTLLTLTLGAGLQAAPLVVKAIASSPASPASLGTNQPLYVQVEYQSDQPLRFQAAGYFARKKREHYSVNPSPVYPAGQGEAVVWFAGDPGARVGQIRVLLYDEKWQVLASVPFPVQAAWHAGAAHAEPAPWAQRLNDAQQRIVAQDMKSNPPGPAGTWGSLLAWVMPFIFLAVPGYPLLQGYAFYRLRGSRRLLSALPLSFMLPAYALSLYALAHGSNLWPLYAIFLSPVALLIVWGLLCFNLWKSMAPRS